MNTDNIHWMAILALDVRPSSVNVEKKSNLHYVIEVLQSETTFRPFETYVARFEDLLDKAFVGHGIRKVSFELNVVERLSNRFERHRFGLDRLQSISMLFEITLKQGCSVPTQCRTASVEHQQFREQSSQQLRYPVSMIQCVRR